MPDAIAPLTDAEAKTVIEPEQPWSDSRAASIALADFETAERYRTANHDPRWRNADELYLAYVAQKTWPGTRVPRASLGVFTAFEQIESLMPHIMGALFGDAEPFDALPQPGTTPDQARAVRDLQTWQLDQAKFRRNARPALKSGLIYGNGALESGWIYEERERTRHFAEFRPQKPVMTPAGPIQRPWKRVVRQKKVPEITNRPFVRYLSIKDFYIDPNCPSTNPKDGRYCCTVALKTIDELLALADDEDFRIPPKQQLVDLANDKTASTADFTKANADMTRGIWWQPNRDSTADAAGQRIEVIAYWTKDRLVWLLNRQVVCYNNENPYGFMPFYNVYYTDVLDRFYAMGICDVVEFEQRLQEGLINGRLDEMALELNASTIKRRGVVSRRSRRYPGAEIEADNPAEDILREHVSNITAQAFDEVAASENRSQKITGITDLAVLGTPTGSAGNSANRTATGIQTQRSASGMRIQYQVGNIEDEFIEPLLDDIQTLNNLFLDPDTPIRLLGQAGRLIEIDPLAVMNADVKFKLRGAAALQARLALQQMLPQIQQFYLNPLLMQELAKNGEKVNMQELANMLNDAASYKPRGALIVKMTPEEIQAQQQQAQQLPPADMARMQMQRERLQAQGQNLDQTHQAKILQEIVKLIGQKAKEPDEKPLMGMEQ